MHFLAPAINNDPGRSEEDVIEQLQSGELTALEVMGEANGVFVTQTLNNTLWLVYAAGSMGKAKTEIIQHIMRGLEYAARKAGCTQIHIMGRRGWIRALAALGFQSQPSRDGLFHIWKEL